MMPIDLARAFLKIWQSLAPPHAGILESSACLLRDTLKLRTESIGICRKSVLRKNAPITEVLTDQYPEDGCMLSRLPRIREGGAHPGRELWLLSGSGRLLYLRAEEERIELNSLDEPPIRIWRASSHLLTDEEIQKEDLWAEVRQVLTWMILPVALEKAIDLFEVEIEAVAFFHEVVQDNGLVHALQTRGVSLKSALPRTLHCIQSSTAIDPIAKLVSHPDVGVRRITTAVLAVLGPERAMNPLIQTLGDSDRGIRQEALAALQACEAPQVLDAVRKLITDEFWWLRAQAARILGRSGGAEDIDLLKTLWDDNDPEDIRHTVSSTAQDAVSKIMERLPPRDEGEDDHLQAGIAALETNDLTAAVSHLRNAAASMPNDPVIYSYLGAACLRGGRLPDALRAFERAVQICPDSPVHQYNLGVAYQRIGRIYEARVAFQTAARLGHPKARQSLSALVSQSSSRAY